MGAAGEIRDLCNVPNSIGYLRIVLVLTAHYCYATTWPALFLVLYSASFALDAVDGYLARKLKQTTAFGAWLDVLVDVVSRGLLWCHLLGATGYLVASLEWLVFLCSHSQLGKSWKEAKGAPAYVRLIMQKNFKTLPGAFVVGSLFLLPLSIYVQQTGLAAAAGVSSFVLLPVIAALAVGRIAAFCVEAWFIVLHIEYLLTNQEGH